MSQDGRESSVEPNERVAQLLRGLNAARKQLGMYGKDHPALASATEELTSFLEQFVACLGHATCVFTQEGVVVNDHLYPSGSDGEELLRRLRERGVMAVTFVGAPPCGQVEALLDFLNVDPRDVRQDRGPSAYLRKRGVTRVVVTEAVYQSGDDSEEEDTAARVRVGAAPRDQAVGAVIDWLSRHDEETEEAERLPIAQIIADPDMAAKLITEAVTKLHKSRRETATGDLANDVINDLKDLASDDPEEWDNAAPQVRRAIAKLPQNIRPTAKGFSELARKPGDDTLKAINVGDIEDMISSHLNKSDAHGNLRLSSEELASLFGVRATGYPSTWKAEMDRTSVWNAAGRTYATLINWENRPPEHRRIAHALASLIPQALETGDLESAAAFAEHLAREATREDEAGWRSANAQAALQSIELASLITLVRQAMTAGSYHQKEVATLLVETAPGLAMALVELLGAYSAEAFNDSLKRGITRYGADVVDTLGRLLRTGSPSAQRSALEVLVGMQSVSAIRTVAACLDSSDEDLCCRALRAISSTANPLVTETCLRALSHRSAEVRLAALEALGSIGDESALPQVAQLAARNAVWGGRVEERVAAIGAIGQIGGHEALGHLSQLAKLRPIIRRRQFAEVREAAQRAAADIRESTGRQGQAA